MKKKYVFVAQIAWVTYGDYVCNGALKFKLAKRDVATNENCRYWAKESKFESGIES